MCSAKKKKSYQNYYYNVFAPTSLITIIDAPAMANIYPYISSYNILTLLLYLC